nr:hypothetical protein [uncultured Blautia sp.]
MLKKRYLAIAGLAALTVVVSGCGKKNTTEQTPVQVTPTETPQATPTATVELVDMEESSEKNVIGEKTATASKAAIVNRTGSEIAAIYIRQTPADDDEESADEWGDDLVNGMFTLKNGENAIYYYEKPSSSKVTYDIRITYTDEEASECFFRNLPLSTIRQITLRMDGSGEDAIPYATYLTANGTKEVSTLSEVKKRLGLDSDSEDPTQTPDDSDSVSPTQTPDDSDNTSPTQTPNSGDNNNNNNNNNNGGDDGGNTSPTDSTIQTAEGYIGRSLDDLISVIGDSGSSEYDEDPDNGTTGYYYYNNFTVSTTVDDDGNEIVTGVW